MSRNNSAGLMSSLLLMTIASSSLPALAQNQAEPEAQVQPLAEVIVTARRRVERLQETPLSVTAFSAERLQEIGATQINDIALRTPGLQYGNFGDLKLSPTSLRGIVSGAGSAGADPAVGYYVDEVYVGQGVGSSLDLYDIERVEVLRGPQGTLFGRNTIGGVINIATKRPSDTFEASIEGEYGNFEHRRVGAALSGPLVEGRLAAKLAVIYDERDGTSDNLALNRDVNDEDGWSARGQLLIAPAEDTSVLLTADYREVDQETLVFETLRYNDAAALPQVLDLFGLPRNADPFDRDVYSDIVTREQLELRGVAANLTTQIGKVEITNVLSYREHEYFSRTDTDRSPLRWVYDGDPEEVRRFAEELRLSFNTGLLRWLAGLYYFEQNSSNLSFIEIGSDLAELFGDLGIAGLQAGSDAELKTESIAGFASVTWSVTDRFDATVGGRYTREEKFITYAQTDPLGLLGGDANFTADDEWSEFTPSANLLFSFTSNVRGYASASKGFKSGGFNDALGDADGIAFDPETLWSYELGLKSELLDRRMAANFAAYYMEWADIQLNVNDPTTPVFDPIILNAGQAHSTGVEGEIQAAVTPRLQLGVNFSVQEARYDEGTLPTGEALREIPFAPKYTAGVNAGYRIPISDAGDLVLFGEVLARGESFLTNDNQEDGRVEDYTLVNLSAGLEAADGRWSLTLWGRNLTDEKVKQRLFDLSDQDVIGQKFIILNDPLTFGIRVRFSL